MNKTTLRFLPSAVLGAAILTCATQAQAQNIPPPAPAPVPAGAAQPAPARPPRNYPFVRVQKPVRLQLGALFPTSNLTRDDINPAIFHGGLGLDFGATKSKRPTFLGGYIDLDYGQNDDNPPISRMVSVGVGVMARTLLSDPSEKTRYYVGAGIGAYTVSGKRDTLEDIPAQIGDVQVSRLRYYARETFRTSFGGKLFAGAEFNDYLFTELTFSAAGSARGYSPTGLALAVGVRF